MCMLVFVCLHDASYVLARMMTIHVQDGAHDVINLGGVNALNPGIRLELRSLSVEDGLHVVYMEWIVSVHSLWTSMTLVANRIRRQLVHTEIDDVTVVGHDLNRRNEVVIAVMKFFQHTASSLGLNPDSFQAA